MSAAKPWPTEIRLDRDKRLLTVAFDDGVTRAFPAELLRVFSPSAEVQGHSPEQRKLVVGKESIRINAIDPIGNYAVRLTFDDGHATGIFSWDYFVKLDRERDSLWDGYLREAAEKGFPRRG